MTNDLAELFQALANHLKAHSDLQDVYVDPSRVAGHKLQLMSSESPVHDLIDWGRTLGNIRIYLSQLSKDDEELVKVNIIGELELGMPISVWTTDRQGLWRLLPPPIEEYWERRTEITLDQLVDYATQL